MVAHGAPSYTSIFSIQQIFYCKDYFFTINNRNSEVNSPTASECCFALFLEPRGLPLAFLAVGEAEPSIDGRLSIGAADGGEKFCCCGGIAAFMGCCGDPNGTFMLPSGPYFLGRPLFRFWSATVWVITVAPAGTD